MIGGAHRSPSARTCALLLSCLLLGAAFARAARAASATARAPLFALVVGVNRAPRARVASLRYADDDAILFHEIFSRLGRSVLLVAPDAATARLYPAMRGAARPTRAALERALQSLLAEVAASRRRGESPRLLFVYSGHGDVKNGEGYLALADGSRLTGADIEQLILARSRAVENHLIVDACRSYFLVRAKRAGGTRSPLARGFHRKTGFLSRYPHTGVLLSTSSGQSSHEWDALQAGVFSHEVRSGLLGGADADRDGQVSYDELSTFLVVANAAIPNQRFRPRFYARGPRGSGSAQLIDLRAFRGERLEIPASKHGRYLLEDQRGVRLADVHSGGRSAVVLRLPRVGTMFLRVATGGAAGSTRSGFGREHRVVARGEAKTLALPPSQPSQYRPKGAAHEAFERIFETPFTARSLIAYRGCLREHARCSGKPCAPCPCATCTLWGEAAQLTADGGDEPAGALVSLDFGMRLMSRELSGERGLGATPSAAGRYRFGPQLLFGAELSLFPLAQTRIAGLSWLGITARYYHSATLAGNARATPEHSGDSSGGRTQLYAFGLLVRVPLGARLVLSLGAEVVGEHSEVETADGTRVYWNRIGLSPLGARLVARVAAFGDLELALRGGAAYRTMFAADEIPLGVADAGVDALSIGHGVAVDGALLLSWRFLRVRLGAFFGYSATSLSRQSCPVAACSTPRIVDRRVGGELVVGARY